MKLRFIAGSALAAIIAAENAAIATNTLAQTSADTDIQDVYQQAFAELNGN